MKRNRGFTAVEIMVVVVIIGFLVAISIPNFINFIKARQESQKNACISNLDQIEKAKEQWTLANAKAVGDAVVEKEVDKYIKGGRPECPAEGRYDYGKIGQEPTCSIKGHVLPVDYAKPVGPVGKNPALAEGEKLGEIIWKVLDELKELKKELKEELKVLNELKELKEELRVLNEDFNKLAESVKILQEMTKEKRE